MSLIDDSTLDSLAATAPNDPAAFFELVEALKSRLHAFSMTEQLDLDNDLTKERRRVRSHFANLKAGFLRLETKQRLIEAIDRADGVPGVEQQEQDKIEAAINVARSELSSCHSDILSLHSSLRSSILSMLTRWAALTGDALIFQETFNKTLNEINKKQIERIFPADQFDAALSESTCSSCLAVHAAALQAAHSSKENTRMEIEKIRSAVSPLEGLVDTLMSEIKSFNKTGRLSMEPASAPSAADEQSRLQQSCDWYRGIGGVIKGLSGVAIDNMDTYENDCELLVRVVHQGRRVVVAVECAGAENECDNKQRTHSEIIGGRIMEGECDNFDEILEHAIQTQDIHFFIREVHAACINA